VELDKLYGHAAGTTTGGAGATAANTLHFDNGKALQTWLLQRAKTEKKGYNDLGDETHDPHDHRILKVLPDVSVGEKLLVVSESYEVRAYLCEAGTVIFKKAVVDGAAQRNQLEDDIDSNEGNQENVSPSIVANDFPSFDFVHILLRYLF
jgi:hypothetical protein